MRKNKLNHNKEMMLGVMALAVVVLCTVIFFWMWCFPNGTTAEATTARYRIRLVDNFHDDSLQIQIGDSVVFDRATGIGSEEIDARVACADSFMMVACPSTGRVSSFTLPADSARITLYIHEEDGSVGLTTD